MADQKADYQEQASSALEKLKGQIDELRVQADLAQAEARDRLTQGIESLRKRQAEARAKIDETQKAGESAWKSAAHQAEALVGDVGEAFSKLSSEVQSAVGAAGSAAKKSREAFFDEWKKMRAQRTKLLEKE